VRGALVLEKIFTIHGAIHWIALNPKEGGSQSIAPIKKGRGRNIYQNNKISIPKCSSCSTLNTESRGILDVAKGRRKC
jgi:hypothetical protein